MAFWPGLESMPSYLISCDKRWHITSFRILLTTILLAFQPHIPSFTHLFPESPNSGPSLMCPGQAFPNT